MILRFQLEQPLITIMSDFGWSSQGVGIMKAIAHALCPHVVIVDITHDITSFSVIEGARQLETISNLPCGIHICVVDPGVGTSRRILGIEAKRGDILIGPDNGVLLPALKCFGGFERAVSIENESYMLTPISKTFQGRDIMIPAAAALANGLDLCELGPFVEIHQLHPPAYEDAEWADDEFRAMVIYVDKKFGAAFLNIWANDFRNRGFILDSNVRVSAESNMINLSVKSTFGSVEPGVSFLFEDEYGRVGMATNLRSFSDIYNIKLGDQLTLRLLP